MDVWLVIANPYAYDKAMWQAVSEAKQLQAKLKVSFFISGSAFGSMMHDLGERGWLGDASLRTLQFSLLEGYRSLAGDVLKRVRRKTEDRDVELIVEGVVEKTSLERYLHNLVAQGAKKVIVATSKSLTPKLEILPATVICVQEE